MSVAKLMALLLGVQESRYAWAWSLGVNLFSWYMQVRPELAPPVVLLEADSIATPPDAHHAQPIALSCCGALSGVHDGTIRQALMRVPWVCRSTRATQCWRSVGLR